MKFFKFYNIHRYNIKRGFMDNFSSSFMKVSSFANVAFSYGFGYFKKYFYNKLISPANKFNYYKNKKKKNEFKK